MGESAPGLLPEMTRAKGLGWARMGCCPNSKHSYGFHMPTPGGGDYSLDAGRNKPVGQYCCAVDIGTTSADGRRYVRMMFDRWDAGLQPVDQAELIGSPDGRKVLYASWKNPGRVELYRGKGHDTWCHSSKFRSLARKDGRWFDPQGPFLGPLLGNVPASDTDTEGSALVAVTDAQWKALVGDVDRLNSQSDRVDDALNGTGPSWAKSNVKKRLDEIDDKLDAVLARLSK